MARGARPPALLVEAFEGLGLGVSVVDDRGRLLWANARCRDLWGATGGRHAAFNRRMTVLAGCAPQCDWPTDDGRCIEVRRQPLPGGAQVLLHDDVTETRQTGLRLAYLARHDELTGLPNRAQLLEQLARELPRTQRGEELALLCLNLDRFKAVNDAMCREAGDRLLRCVGERLRHSLRDGDLLARLGGDEFAVLQFGAGQPAGATTLARRLIELLAQPFDLDGQSVYIGVSVGIAVAPFDGETPEALLKAANLAQDRAKSAGGEVLRFFEPGMDACVQRRRQLEADLREALVCGGFELAYQPQVALADGAVVGVEALIRWNHPRQGRVSPLDFIPLAEDSGLIIPLGRWVLREACRAAAQWPGQVRVAVNVSPVQFRSRSLVLDVVEALAASGLTPQRLELEITEAVLMQDTDHALAMLHELRGRGVRTALDDFGTGYSSLGYLRRFPFDKLKIDRSFVSGVESGGDALAIMCAITGLGRSLGMTTVAEGVETRAQLAAVQSTGCAEVQGYLFSRPRPAAEIPALILCGIAPA